MQPTTRHFLDATVLAVIAAAIAAPTATPQHVLTRMNVRPTVAQASGDGHEPPIEAAARLGAFASDATDLADVLPILVRHAAEGGSQGGVVHAPLLPPISASYDAVLGARFEVRIENTRAVDTVGIVFAMTPGLPAIPLWSGVVPAAGLVLSDEFPTDDMLGGLAFALVAYEIDRGAARKLPITRTLDLVLRR